MRIASLTGALLLLANAAGAQTARAIPDIALDALKISKGGVIADGDAILVPTAIMHFSIGGSMWVQAKSGGANAQGHAVYITHGLERKMLQDLTQKMVDDLVERLRGAGYKVLTWEDVKNDPEIAKWELREDDKDVGMPTDDQVGQTFVTVGPSDAQQIKYGITGIHWKFRGIAKNLNATVLVPEYFFNSPQINMDKEKGYKRASVSIDAEPSLRMAPALAWMINPKGGGGLIQLEGMGYVNFMTDSVGVVTHAKTDKANLGFMKKMKVGYEMVIDPPLYLDGALHEAKTFNSAIAKVAVKEKK